MEIMMILIDTIRYGATTTIYLMKTFATPVAWFLTALANCMRMHLGIELTLRACKLLLLSAAAAAAAAAATIATIAAIAATATAAKAAAAATQLPVSQADANTK